MPRHSSVGHGWVTMAFTGDGIPLQTSLMHYGISRSKKVAHVMTRRGSALPFYCSMPEHFNTNPLPGPKVYHWVDSPLCTFHPTAPSDPATRVTYKPAIVATSRFAQAPVGKYQRAACAFVDMVCSPRSGQPSSSIFIPGKAPWFHIALLVLFYASGLSKRTLKCLVMVLTCECSP